MTLTAARQSLLALAALGLALLGGSSRADSAAEAFRTAPELGQGFQALGTRGVIALYDEQARRWTVSDARRAFQSFRPASTFKIPGTLIALEAGVASDETQVFKWDGQKRWNEDWNQDQTLQTAFRFSAVWVYQHIARQVGAEGMQSRLWAWRYGNAVAGPKHDSFWLDGDLRITAVQQIDFLRRLAEHRLPISERSAALARRVFLREETPAWRLFAKTGWDGTGPVELGWFVGWTERKTGAGRCFFALNMDMQIDAKALPQGAKKPTQHELIRQLGPHRERLAREALQAQGCLD
ncbi:class D beta-lactamase [Mitsuaria sp. WAJ17]|uniref:class D beta-lactamase n=1 Tax=Mitsuaria sp. WAJ17 TaxID=2761452 RepID=UPI001602D3C8|nr:class D beta-lactamase [Mitsuaria sp. WAJ17]MBB2486171.1 class D beta-lactamase [Mitsuaria sp. WAJ17]